MKVTLFPTTTTGTLPRSRPSLICEYIPETYSKESGQSKSKTKMYALASRIPYAETKNKHFVIILSRNLGRFTYKSLLNGSKKLWSPVLYITGLRRDKYSFTLHETATALISLLLLFRLSFVNILYSWESALWSRLKKLLSICYRPNLVIHLYVGQFVQ